MVPPPPRYNGAEPPASVAPAHFKFISADQLRRAFSFQSVESGWLPPGTCRWGVGANGVWLVKVIRPASYNLNLEVLSPPPPLPLSPPAVTLNTITDNPEQTGIDPTPPNNFDAASPARAATAKTIKSLHLALPGLVFGGVGNTYYVWAVKGGDFYEGASGQGSGQINPNARLYHAPLPNLYGDGHICFGNNAAPILKGGKELEAAWQLFLDSPFNGDLVAGKSKQHPRDVRAKLFDLVSRQQGRRPIKYPAPDLVPLDSSTSGGNGQGITLAEAVEKYIERKKGREIDR